MTRTIDIARDANAPQVARLALNDLDTELDPTVLEDTRLLVSELVSNAVRHGDGDQVRVVLDVMGPTRVRCEVIDNGDGFLPIARRPDDPREGGWGLHLVEQLSQQWGVREGSTHVWFELGA
jgi:signal transduction histidine kinase